MVKKSRANWTSISITEGESIGFTWLQNQMYICDGFPRQGQVTRDIASMLEVFPLWNIETCV